MLKEKTSDVSMTNTNQGSGTAAEAAVPMSHGLWNTWRKNLLLFCLTGVYVELCLHLCVFGSMDRYAGYPVLFGLLGGALCTLVVSSLPKVLRQITGVFLVAAQVLLAEVQLVYHCIFGDFMPVSQIGMGGNVVVNFNSQLLYGIRQNLLKILLLLLPLIVVILCLALRRAQALKLRLRWKQTMASFAVLLALLLTVTGLMYVGRDNAFSVYRTFTNVNTSTDSSYKKIGMLATTAQELRYMLFSGSGSIMITPSSLNMSDVPRTYSSNSYNVIESIDFTALADSTDSDILKATDEYLSNATPTRKNNYTGLLKDYNLITICAESFCPWFISEELTPTLYKLSHTGILFENYYGTFQSVTTNGEYTMCMGLYPDMSRTKTDSSFNVAGTNYLPFCLGNALKGMGYQAWGYHDYIGDFYNDMNRWSFNLQMYFLGSRIQQTMDILRSGPVDIFQDRTVYEDAYIFADNLHRMGLMSGRDFDTYMSIFGLITNLVPRPDLLIYLKASVPTLISQIRRRGRAYEMNIDEQYLRRLNDRYDDWIENIYRGEVLVIDKDREDFVADAAVMEKICARLDRKREELETAKK